MKLIAVIPILYRDRQYWLGDELPLSDDAMKETWINGGAAVAKEDSETPKKVAKAVPASATPGITGVAVGGEGAMENLAGKIPATPKRRRK